MGGHAWGGGLHMRVCMGQGSTHVSVYGVGVHTCECACVATGTRVKVGVLMHAGVSSTGCHRGTYGVRTVYLTIWAGGWSH